MFLGTSGSVPTAQRAPSALLLRRGGERLAWKVAIFFPWDPDKRLFRGERVYTAGLPLPAASGQ